VGITVEVDGTAIVCVTKVRADDIAVFCMSGMLSVDTAMSVFSRGRHPLSSTKETMIIEDMITIRLEIFIDVNISQSSRYLGH
jgi:hypothetical protein